MTELQLYKFIHENELEISWCGDALIVWIGFYWIEEFANLIGYDYLSEGGEEVRLQCDCIALNIVDLCEHFNIEPENILKKE